MQTRLSALAQKQRRVGVRERHIVPNTDMKTAQSILCDSGKMNVEEN